MEEKQLAKSKRVISQYKKTFATPDGRAVLYDLMKGNYFINSTTFVPGDSHATARNEGQRDVVVRILSILKVDPEQFFKIAEEQEESHV